MKLIEIKKSLPDDIITLLTDILAYPFQYESIAICYTFQQNGITSFNFKDTCNSRIKFFGLMQAGIAKATNEWGDENSSAKEPYE